MKISNIKIYFAFKYGKFNKLRSSEDPKHETFRVLYYGNLPMVVETKNSNRTMLSIANKLFKKTNIFSYWLEEGIDGFRYGDFRKN